METISASPGRLSILAVDIHPLMAAGLHEIFCAVAEEVQLKGASIEDAFAMLNEHADADLIFLDPDRSRADPPSCVRRFRAPAPAVPLVLYTIREDPRLLIHVLAQGASGVIPKSHSSSLARRGVE